MTAFFLDHGSVFDVVDSYNEVVASGAFLESIEETRAKGGRSLFSGSIAPVNPHRELGYLNPERR
ncbi:hypothetical protein LNQ03_02935 [Klebsiella pneumoniae subsp. pneumoniae]|nr:hypothetical protein [Klebsiella pneumoniae subsp. pneumoniae]